MRWFEEVTVETTLKVYVTKPKGDLCWECGCICESRPSELPEVIADSYKKKPEYRMWFEGCRKILTGAAARDWRPNSVNRDVVVGMKCKADMCFVRLEHLTQFYKAQSIGLSDLGPEFSKPPSTVIDPEGVTQSGILLKPSALPVGLPFFSVELYSLSQVVLQDTFLGPTDALHELHGQFAQAWLKNDEFEKRGIRISGVANALCWSDFDAKVRLAQRLLQEREEERLRQVGLADAGMAPDSGVAVLTTGSRLRRSAAVDTATMRPPVLTTPKRKQPPGGALGGIAKKVAVLAGTSGVSVAPSFRSGSSSRAGSTIAGSVHASAASVVGSVNPGVAIPLAGGVSNPELAKLLVSSHGKTFPTIAEIMAGAAVKRELGGARSENSTLSLVLP